MLPPSGAKTAPIAVLVSNSSAIGIARAAADIGATTLSGSVKDRGGVPGIGAATANDAAARAVVDRMIRIIGNLPKGAINSGARSLPPPPPAFRA